MSNDITTGNATQINELINTFSYKNIYVLSGFTSIYVNKSVLSDENTNYREYTRESDKT